MECEAARAHLADRLTGEAAANTVTGDALADHLRSCPACAAAAAAAEDTWTLLGEIPAATPDSAAMRARFDAILAASAPKPRSGSMHGLQAAAAVLLVAIGFLVGRQTMPAPAAGPAIEELREELRATRQMVSLSLLQQQSASERLRGINYTTQIDQPGGELVGALIDTLLHDPDTNVRLKTIEALKRFADRQNVLRAAADALTEPASSPLVQIELIDFLVEANARESVPVLQRLAGDLMANKAVRARAAWGVQHIG